MKKIAILIIGCSCIIGGCSSLVLEEQKRALDEAYSKGKIDKIEYLTSKSKMEQKQKNER